MSAMKHWTVTLLVLLLFGVAAPAGAQDALNLPTDLYVLLNDGVVQRYGVGGQGITTVTPAEAFVIDFAVSPDGERIAYRSEAGLVIGDITAQGAGAVVDEMGGYPPLRGTGATIAWTPQADAIAYTTPDGARIYYTGIGAFATITQPNLVNLTWSPDGVYLLAEATFDIWWIYKREGSQLALRAAIPGAYGATWISPSELVFAPIEGGLVSMDLNNANRQTPLLSNRAEYRLPVLAPDGRLMFFRRERDDANIPEGYGLLVALAPGSPDVQVRGEAAIDLGGGLRWGPAATLMVAFQGGVLALFDPMTGQGFPLPISNAVAFAWGPYPPPAREAEAMTTDAIFPEEFPTLDPSATIPGVELVPVDATAEVAAQG